MKYFMKNECRNLNNIINFGFILIFIFSMFFSFTFIVNAEDLVISSSIDNPLGDDIQDIPTFIAKIVEIVLLVGIPVVALSIMYAGFLFVKAQGNVNTIKKAKEAILFAIIGAVLVLGAYVISEAIVNTVEEIKSNS